MATKASHATAEFSATVNGTADLVHSEAVDAAIVFLTGAGSTNPQDWALFSVGFWDGTNQTAMGGIDEHNTGTTDNARYVHGARIVAAPTTSGALGVEGTASKVTTTVTDDTVRVTTNDAYGTTAARMSAIMLSGVTNAKAGWFDYNSDAAPDSPGAIGFEPDLVIMATSMNGADPPAGAGWMRTLVGFSHRNSSGTYKHHGINVTADNSQSAGRMDCTISDDYAITAYWQSALQMTCIANDFRSTDGGRFSFVRQTGTANNRIIHYLALKLADPDDFDMDLIDTQTSTGNWSHTGFGFQGDVLGLFANGCAAADTNYDANVGTFMAGFGDSSTERVVAYCAEDAADPTNTESYYDNSNILSLKFDDGTTDCVASLSSLNSNGFTLNYSNAASSATKVLAFTFGDSTAAGPVTHEAALSFAGEHGAAPSANAIFEALTTFDVQADDSLGGVGDYQATLAMAVELSELINGTMAVDASTTVSALIALALDEDSAIEVSAALGGVLNAILSADASMSADTPLGSVLNALVSAAMVTAGQLNVGSTLADVFAGGVAMDVTLSFNGQHGFLSDGVIVTGPQTHEVALSVGLVQDISQLGVANMFAATSLGSTVQLVTLGGSDVEAALALALQDGITTEAEVSIEGALSVGLQQAIGTAVQGDLGGLINLSHQAAVQLIAGGVLEAGLSLGSIKSITMDGFILVVGIVTPDGRTITVRAIDRTIAVPGISRDIDIKH